jgi:hypothetical protein
MIDASIEGDSIAASRVEAAPKAINLTTVKTLAVK